MFQTICIEFQSHRFLDQRDSDHQFAAIAMANYYPFESFENPFSNPDPLSDRDETMRLQHGAASDAQTDCIDVSVVKRCGGPVERQNANHAWYRKRFQLLVDTNTHKHITREQGKFKLYPAVLPSA